MKINRKKAFPAIIMILLTTLIVYDFSVGNYISRGFLFIKSKIENPNKWGDTFQQLSIPSGEDTEKQPIYVFQSTAKTPKPLIISLHSWNGDYSEKDPLAKICEEKNINYIHPNFGGPNNNPEACCSESVIKKIDEAIDYAVSNLNVDINNIHLIGVSGGGYAALCHYLKSKKVLTSYSSWVGISNLEAWYQQSLSQENQFWKDILMCTESTNVLNITEARKRSPIYLPSDTTKKSIDLKLFTGIHDGVRGSVPITQSINFYNKMVSDLYGEQDPAIVTDSEILKLLELRKPIGNFGNIGKRKLILHRQTKTIQLFIFEGEHEILSNYAISSLFE